MDTPSNPPTSNSPAAPAPPQMNGLALTSMILGISGIFFFCFTGLPAVICGHIAQKQIKKSNGTQTGKGFALTGLITGYAFGALSVVILAGLSVPVAMKALAKAEQVKSISSINLIQNRISEFHLDNGAYPASLQELFPDKLSMEDLALTPVGTRAKTKAALEYVPGLSDTSPSTFIILYGPAAFQGEVVVGRIDGTVDLVPEADFLREASAQGLPFPTWHP